MPTSYDGPGLLRLRVGRDDDVSTYSLRVDRLAATKDGTLYLLGLAGSQGALKGVRAWLNAKVPAVAEFEGVEAARGNRSSLVRSGRPHEEPYTVHVHPLGYGWCHALFLSRRDGFLPSLGEPATWRALKSPRFTTPLLRSWVPHVARQLEGAGLLRSLYCCNCDCGLITAETANLDRIVSAGVADGSLPFRELALVGA